MVLFLFLVIIIIIIINSQKLNNSKEKLLFVSEHFRHGARQPYSSFDDINWKDVFNENWKGYGELTPLGMRMHYLLGISNKKQYYDFLKEYNPNEILIRSTNVNRTILSAFSTLQGLFNNSNISTLNQKQINRGIIQNKNYSRDITKIIQNLGYKTIEGGFSLFPVHIYPTNYDHQYQIFRKDECPGIENYINNVTNSSEVKNISYDICDKVNKTYGDYIFNFMNKSGIDEPFYLYDFDNLFDIADTFVADYFNGKKLKIINDTGINMDDFYIECLNISSTDSYYRTFGFSPSELLYISVSPSFNSLFNYMDKRIELDKKGKSELLVSDSPKFVLIAGHDNSLALNDLFLKYEFNIDYEKAVYSQSQVYELWKNEIENKYYIRYLVNQKQIALFDYEDFKIKVNTKIYSSEMIDEICKGNNAYVDF